MSLSLPRGTKVLSVGRVPNPYNPDQITAYAPKVYKVTFRKGTEIPIWVREKRYRCASSDYDRVVSWTQGYARSRGMMFIPNLHQFKRLNDEDVPKQPRKAPVASFDPFRDQLQDKVTRVGDRVITVGTVNVTKPPTGEAYWAVKIYVAAYRKKDNVLFWRLERHLQPYLGRGEIYELIRKLAREFAQKERLPFVEDMVAYTPTSETEEKLNKAKGWYMNRYNREGII